MSEDNKNNINNRTQNPKNVPISGGADLFTKYYREAKKEHLPVSEETARKVTGRETVYSSDERRTYKPAGRDSRNEYRSSYNTSSEGIKVSGNSYANLKRPNYTTNRSTVYSDSARHGSENSADKDFESSSFEKQMNENREKRALREKADASSESARTDLHSANDVLNTPKNESDINKQESSIKEKAKAESVESDSGHSFFRSFIPWKGDTGKEKFRKIIMDVSAVLIICCFVYFISDYVTHHNQQTQQNEIANQTTEADKGDDLAAQWAAIKAKYPNVNFPDGMNIRFAELYAKNQDLVGWLTIDGTNIDTPIVQHTEDYDNNAGQDYYLRRDIYGKYNKYGNAYLDMHNSGKVLDKNNTIYGHNMSDGLMFGQLTKYYKLDGYKESPIIKYSTLFHDYKFRICSVMITNGYSEADNGYLFYYPTCYFPNDKAFTTFEDALAERSLYDTGAGMNKDDKLIMLSTCSYEITEPYGRLVVVGRLLRDGESDKIDTSVAKENTNVRYPQMWYDLHGKTNPYANAYKWKISDYE